MAGRTTVPPHNSRPSMACITYGLYRRGSGRHGVFCACLHPSTDAAQWHAAVPQTVRLQELLWLMRLTPVPADADASSHAPFCAEAVRRYAACRRWPFHRTVGVLWCVWQITAATNHRSSDGNWQR